MFDLRDENDIVRDLKKLVEICEDAQKYKSAFNAVCIKLGVEKVVPCEHDINNIGEILHCKECGGTRWKVIMKDENVL